MEFKEEISHTVPGETIKYLVFDITNNSESSVKIDLQDRFDETEIAVATGVNFYIKFERTWWMLEYANDDPNLGTLLIAPNVTRKIWVPSHFLWDVRGKGLKFIVDLNGIRSEPFSLDNV